MSEGADSVAQTCGATRATLSDAEGERERERERRAATTPSTPTSTPTEPSPPPLPLPPTSPTDTGRRPRFGTAGAPPPSPYVWIDGRQLRSALAWTKKWPPRRVSFPLSDSHLVTGYLEPDNPWRHGEYSAARLSSTPSRCPPPPPSLFHTWSLQPE